MIELMERTDRAHYEADLKRVQALESPAWMKDIREAGAARFAEMDFPHYKQEAWRLTNVGPVIKTPFRSVVGEPSGHVTPDDVAAHLYDAPEWTQLVFVDGFLSRELSRMGDSTQAVRVGGIGEAVAKGDEILEEHLAKSAEYTNAFVALNTAFLQDGAYIHVSEGAAPSAPIHLLFISTGVDTIASYPRNLIILGKSAEAEIVESYVGLNNTAGYLNNVVTEIVMEDNATLRRYKVVLEGSAGHHLATTKVMQGRDTNFHSFSISLTGQIVRNELDVVLGGEGANALLSGLYLNDGDRLIDNALRVTHASPKCYSRMAYKGVLDGTSRSVFTGKVLVPQGSQQTDSNQLNNNLLLSDKATLDTKPQLEIFADDVKCTHGATIGGFPRELIFYFQSRGMTEAMAHAILTFGFASEIVDKINIDPLRERLSKYVFDKYRPK